MVRLRLLNNEERRFSGGKRVIDETNGKTSQRDWPLKGT
jgi:hypothetical protein